MPDKWVTFAEAAAALKVHPRTVERQIKSGKLQSRRTDAGQLEVLIDIAESSGTSADAVSVVAGQAENQVQFAWGPVGNRENSAGGCPTGATHSSALGRDTGSAARVIDRVECGRGDGGRAGCCCWLDGLSNDALTSRTATCRRTGQISVRRCRTSHSRSR